MRKGSITADFNSWSYLRPLPYLAGPDILSAVKKVGSLNTIKFHVGEDVTMRTYSHNSSLHIRLADFKSRRIIFAVLLVLFLAIAVMYRTKECKDHNILLSSLTSPYHNPYRTQGDDLSIWQQVRNNFPRSQGFTFSLYLAEGENNYKLRELRNAITAIKLGVASAHITVICLTHETFKQVTTWIGQQAPEFVKMINTTSMENVNTPGWTKNILKRLQNDLQDYSYKKLKCSQNSQVEGERICWNKIMALKVLSYMLTPYKVTAALDLDVILNFEVDSHPLNNMTKVMKSYDFVGYQTGCYSVNCFHEQPFSMNGGFLLFKNSKATMELFNLWFQYLNSINFRSHEQAALQSILNGYETLSARLGWLPINWMCRSSNFADEVSYLYSISFSRWGLPVRCLMYHGHEIASSIFEGQNVSY